MPTFITAFGRRSAPAVAGATSALFVACMGLPGLAAGTVDSFAPYGPSTVKVPFTRAYTFAVYCAALPCQIKLAEHATARGRHIGGLDKAPGTPITMTEQPSAGPEPHCTEAEELEAPVLGECQALETWEKQKAQDIYVVWFERTDLNGQLLNRTLKRSGAVTLHVTATLTDAAENRITASRSITLRLAQTAAQRHRQEQREAEAEKRQEDSPRGKAESAEDEYCVNVLRGEYGGSFVSNGHVYTRCHVGQFGSRHEVSVTEANTRG